MSSSDFDLRKYGRSPYKVAVVHGGPGAAGEMAPVARELSSQIGIIEPFQMADSLEGQIEELRQVLETHGQLPLILIGFSWGAWLSYLVAARYPSLIRKLILVSSGPFREQDAKNILITRLNRLSDAERTEAKSLMGMLNDPTISDKNKFFARFGALLTKADAYDPIQTEQVDMTYRHDIFQKVWPEAAALRQCGTLLEMGRQITCPVIAIHGDYDPHPAEGVQGPLSQMLKEFRFVFLEKCGHKSWIEKWAREKFFQVLRDEIII